MLSSLGINYKLCSPQETWLGTFICEIRQLVVLVDLRGETVLVYGKIVKISFWGCGRSEGIPHINCHTG